MQQELKKLQGSWRVTALDMDGQKLPAAMLEGACIVVEGDRFKSLGMGADYEGTLRLTRPGRLDLTFDSGPEKGNTNLGIYELDGDQWRICLATRGKIRPAEFRSKPGSGIAVETLIRGEAAAPSKTPAKAAKRSGAPTEFEGDWRMISGVMDGQPMEKSAVSFVKRVTRGNLTTVYAGPQVMMQFEFSHDATTSPGTLEYRNTAGTNKGKTQHAIYELKGELLKVCVAAPGASRPLKFESKPGSGNTLTLWKRAITGAAEEHLNRVRRICGSLPETSEKMSHGEPTFFAYKKVIAMFDNNHHGDGHVAVWVPAPPGVQEMLVDGSPGTYFRPPYVGVKGWVGIELPRIADDELAEHLLEAYRMVAPKAKKAAARSVRR